MKKPKKSIDRLFHIELGQAARTEALEERMREALELHDAVCLMHLAKISLFRSRRVKAGVLREVLRSMDGATKPRPKKPPKREGGEPIPAIPRPKPTPFSGGAGAPVEFEEREQRPARTRFGFTVPAAGVEDTGLRL